MAGLGIEGIEGVVLGDGEDTALDNEGFGIDGPIKLNMPGLREFFRIEHSGDVTTSEHIMVVGGPIVLPQDNGPGGLGGCERGREVWDDGE
jgi:hypothetical protein